MGHRNRPLHGPRDEIAAKFIRRRPLEGLPILFGRRVNFFKSKFCFVSLQRSTVDQAANMQILLLFFLLVLLSLLASSCNEIWASNFGFHHWYLGLEGKCNNNTSQTINKFRL